MTSKQALLVGCGSKWGAEFAKELADQNYSIDLVTGSELIYSNINNIKINWNSISPSIIESKIDPNKKYDLIFFNQNSGGSPNDHFLKSGNKLDINSWNYSFWINCQLPYIIVQHLTNSISSTTKIGWMLTGLIIGREKNLFKYAGYASTKSTNLHLMRGFSEFHHGIFFAINPIWFPIENYKVDAKQIYKVIENLSTADNGKTFTKDGREWI